MRPSNNHHLGRNLQEIHGFEMLCSSNSLRGFGIFSNGQGHSLTKAQWQGQRECSDDLDSAGYEQRSGASLLSVCNGLYMFVPI